MYYKISVYYYPLHSLQCKETHKLWHYSLLAPPLPLPPLNINDDEEEELSTMLDNATTDNALFRRRLPPHSFLCLRFRKERWLRLCLRRLAPDVIHLLVIVWRIRIGSGETMVVCEGRWFVELLLKETKTDDLGRFTSHRCRHDLKRILRYAVGIVAVG
jgi:hypothetical protein